MASKIWFVCEKVAKLAPRGHETDSLFVSLLQPALTACGAAAETALARARTSAKAPVQMFLFFPPFEETNGPSGLFVYGPQNHQNNIFEPINSAANI